MTYLNFYFPLKDGGGSQFEKKKNVYMENAGADRMAYMTINDKNCNLSIVLTAMDKKTAKIR